MDEQLVQAVRVALEAVAEKTKGDRECLRDEEACYRLHGIHFDWYQLGETGVSGTTDAIARIAVAAVEAEHHRRWECDENAAMMRAEEAF